MADQVIATVPKNRLEEIRVSFSEYQGHQLLKLGVRFEADDGQMRPGRAGLAFKIDKLPDFADAVSLALEKAREGRLIP